MYLKKYLSRSNIFHAITYSIISILAFSDFLVQHEKLWRVDKIYVLNQSKRDDTCSSFGAEQKTIGCYSKNLLVWLCGIFLTMPFYCYFFFSFCFFFFKKMGVSGALLVIFFFREGKIQVGGPLPAENLTLWLWKSQKNVFQSKRYHIVWNFCTVNMTFETVRLMKDLSGNLMVNSLRPLREQNTITTLFGGTHWLSRKRIGTTKIIMRFNEEFSPAKTFCHEWIWAKKV